MAADNKKYSVPETIQVSENFEYESFDHIEGI